MADKKGLQKLDL
ncbi:unnamed protein product, partial [Rotaria sp. Silwood1]